MQKLSLTRNYHKIIAKRSIMCEAEVSKREKLLEML